MQMGYKDIVTATFNISPSLGAGSIMKRVSGITANHVLLNDSFPEAMDDIEWATSSGYVTISPPIVFEDGTIYSKYFDYTATLFCVFGVPDN